MLNDNRIAKVNVNGKVNLNSGGNVNQEMVLVYYITAQGIKLAATAGAVQNHLSPRFANRLQRAK